ncbi:anti-sigma F factor, partial [Oceanobacillus massiliensis]|uniref:ATP-binding protein n=1 Tax=Oceanobacillus massiliensis TaxID=1465765 RepID=UPI003016175D
AFARVTVAAFITQLDPTMDEVTEIKTVVSEGVTNAIIHGYNGESHHKIFITCSLDDGEIELTIKDEGIG